MDGDVMQSSWAVGNNSTFGSDCKGGREILTSLIDKHRARGLVGRK